MRARPRQWRSMPSAASTALLQSAISRGPGGNTPGRSGYSTDGDLDVNKLMYGGSITALLMAMGIAAPGLANAADATADTSTATTTTNVGEVIVTGTRQTGVTAADSAAPVQVVGSSALVKTGAIDLASSLAA